jgi:hypothetical protein
LKKISLAVIFILALLRGYAQPYVARDLTAENLFSENIEGPNVNKAGNLFVVNYQKTEPSAWCEPMAKWNYMLRYRRVV